MQTTQDSPALIQTVHGTSFPFVGLARQSQSSIIDSAVDSNLQANRQPNENAKPDGSTPNSSGQSSEV